MSPHTTALLTPSTPLRRLVLVGLFCGAVAWAIGPAGRLLVLLPLLLLGPGYLLTRAARLQLPLPLFTMPALWLGLSLSMLTLLYLWTWTLGLALGALALGTLALGLGAALCMACWLTALPPPMTRATYAYGTAWLAVLSLTLLTRFSQIRSLALPPWVDSVHHALLVRIVAETGTIPISLRPYLPVDELPYHWGYHVVAGALLSLSGLNLPQLMLWSGQVLNALSVVAVAGLAAVLWRSPLAALGAGIVTGLLSNMPAYYLSWGRYTQLTGLLVLPPLTMMLLQLLHEARNPAARGVRLATLSCCAALLLAGLLLIHYRVLVFWLPLLLLAVLLEPWREPTTDQATPRWLGLLPGQLVASRTTAGVRAGASWLRAGFWMVLVGAAALLLTLPWLLVLLRRVLLSLVARPAGLVGSPSYNGLSEVLFWTGNNRWLFTLAAAAALWALLRRRRAALIVVLWVGTLMLMANPTTVGLPAIWLLTNDSVLILLYLPASLLLGGGLALLANELRSTPAAHTVLLVSLGTASLLGAWQLRDVVNKETLLTTPADLPAITWAAEATPADARFLVSARPWLQRVNRGGDGGWWLLPLTGRWVAVPPVLYTYAERDEIDQIYARTSAIAALTDRSGPELLRLIDEYDIDYIYSSGTEGSFPPSLIDKLDNIELVYQHDPVKIFKVSR